MLMLRLVYVEIKTGRRCANNAESLDLASVSNETDLYFHFAFGFRIALRHAYMLDSLIRVSRRAEKPVDHSSPTLCTTRKCTRTVTLTAVEQHCKQSSSVERSTKDEDPCLQEAGTAIPRSERWTTLA